ncbi:hypothetical protein M0P65_06560 [Candidatus Gracilibacteria bacterium]|jgi:hypothetical protein|nr:hypothetical protein [Candidatus Gracilibacteria bacterium]
MNVIDLQSEFNHIPNETETAIDPVTGTYSDRYTEWLESKAIALQEIINSHDDRNGPVQRMRSERDDGLCG